MPTDCWVRQNDAPLKFDTKPSEAAFSAVFLNFDKCRPKVAHDFISSLAVDLVGANVHVKIGK